MSQPAAIVGQHITLLLMGKDFFGLDINLSLTGGSHTVRTARLLWSLRIARSSSWPHNLTNSTLNMAPNQRPEAYKFKDKLMIDKELVYRRELASHFKLSWKVGESCFQHFKQDFLCLFGTRAASEWNPCQRDANWRVTTHTPRRSSMPIVLESTATMPFRNHRPRDWTAWGALGTLVATTHRKAGSHLPEVIEGNGPLPAKEEVLPMSLCSIVLQPTVGAARQLTLIGILLDSQFPKINLSQTSIRSHTHQNLHSRSPPWRPRCVMR